MFFHANEQIDGIFFDFPSLTEGNSTGAALSSTHTYTNMLQ